MYQSNTDHRNLHGTDGVSQAANSADSRRGTDLWQLPGQHVPIEHRPDRNMHHTNGGVAGEKISADSTTAACTCSACGEHTYQSNTDHRIETCTAQTVVPQAS